MDSVGENKLPRVNVGHRVCPCPRIWEWKLDCISRLDNCREDDSGEDREICACVFEVYRLLVPGSRQEGCIGEWVVKCGEVAMLVIGIG